MLMKVMQVLIMLTFSILLILNYNFKDTASSVRNKLIDLLTELTKDLNL